ncbi:serine hydrolase [Streptomyces sp. NBC_00210]|uniref:D-alanyl-D-alanine carboxypeptidase n=1 Tax=unclassified Streptomyces TaxID=2593676 RepID=UPI0032492B15
MTHGGGTVAGESPDKSEQRKSSGETTSGERDPRLAVFRQASPPKVDQPTAIFKLPPERGPAPEPGTESGSAENDARLRAAVAAWVASGDGDAKPTPGEPDAAGDAADGGDSADAGAPEADAADGGDSADAEDPSDGPDAAGAPETADSAVEGASDGEARDVEAPDAAAAGADASGVAPADTDAPDAEVADAPDAEGPSGAAASDAETPDEAAEAPSDAAAGAGGSEGPGAPVAEAPDAEDAPSAADAEDAPDASVSAAAAEDAGASSDVEPAPEGETGTDTATDDRADETSGDGGAAATAAEADKAPAGDAPAEAKDDASAEAQPTHRDEADEADEADDDAPTPAAPPSAEDGAPASADAKPTPAAKGSASASSDVQPAPSVKDKPVDQPTAVFKAPRRPAVDNPTTALKLPPASRPEAPAGRSSTFVPLRGEGSATPAPSKPEAAAAAPASLTEAERTKQQPMPPLPPLDLLAELTNTPPPPQTPVRTVIRRVKIWTPLVLLLLIIFAVVQVLRPLPDPKLDLSAASTFTFKGGKLSLPFPDEGQGAVEVEGVGSIGTYGAQKPAPLASVAKTMTAYVILRDHPLKGQEVGPKITVDQQAADESNNKDESRANFSLGQQFTEKQMLQLLMIPSSNNAARLLARWDAQSEAGFVKKMNDAAKDLGMTNSTYTDPSGLKSTTVSTPQDQLKLAKAVMQNDVFRKIVDTTLTTIPGIDGTIRNNNDKALLEPGVGGIKTGSSTPAGGNLLWAANVEVDGTVRRIVGVAMGAQKATILDDKLNLAIDYSIAMIKAAQKGVTSATVVKKGDVVGYVDDGLGGRTAVVATKELKAVGWGGLDVTITLTDGAETVPHSAKAGTVVGELSVGAGTGKVTAPVALQQDLTEPGFGAKLTRLG